jgi:predicted nuclease of predicted toxin-antitoxin system
VRVLLDADISSRRLISSLERAGHDVLALGGQAEYSALADEEVLQLAADENRILVTRNSRDFAPLARLWAEAGRVHAGLVLIWSLRNDELRAICAGLEQVFERYPRTRQWRSLAVAI